MKVTIECGNECKWENVRVIVRQQARGTPATASGASIERP